MGGTMSRRRFVGRHSGRPSAGSELLRVTPAFAKSTVGAEADSGAGSSYRPFELATAKPRRARAATRRSGSRCRRSPTSTARSGAADIQGTATGSDGSSWFFDTDMRFMDGEYVGEDGKHHHGTFGFV